MALSPLRSKALHHGRSLSLPSGSHPATSQFDENLFRVRASEASPCLSLSSMNNKINGLKSLYSSVDDLLLLPHIHQTISQESREKWAEQILDGYIRLLDACSSAKDLVSCTKQHVQELLSALRRKDMQGIHCYLASRRTSKKMIQKCLRFLRSFKSKGNVLCLDKDQETMSLVHMLKESETVAFTMLESLLSYVMGTKVQSSSSGWSLVSKLMQRKKASYQGTKTTK